MSYDLQQAAIEAAQGRSHKATLLNFRSLLAPKARYLVDRLEVHAACHDGGTAMLHDSTAKCAEELAALAAGLARYLRAHSTARPGDERALVQAMAEDVLSCTGA